MGVWVKALEAKARIIHGQLAAARKLAEEAGLDPDDVAQPYLDLINDLYRDEWQFAQSADEDRTLTFSQREGYDPLPKPLQLGELPDEARTAIWNVLSEHMERSSYDHAINELHWKELGLHDINPYERGPLDPWNVILGDMADKWSMSFNRVVPWMQDRLKKKPFNRVFDLIEFVMRHDHCSPEFITDVSDVFHRFKLAYMIDSGPPAAIFPATTVEEGKGLDRNLDELRKAGLNASTIHLQRASKCINDGDSKGSIRESIHAVESVAKQIVDPHTTLGKALNLLERQGVLRHKALKEALSKLYGWTSDEDGIRHALLEEGDGLTDEAVFMLGACASFASYLWRKHKAANPP